MLNEFQFFTKKMATIPFFGCLEQRKSQNQAEI